MRYCLTTDCLNMAVRSGRCWRCLKRVRQGKSLVVDEPRPFERVILAAHELLEAEEDDEYNSAELRLRRTVEAWAQNLGWRPPKGKRR